MHFLFLSLLLGIWSIRQGDFSSRRAFQRCMSMSGRMSRKLRAPPPDCAEVGDTACVNSLVTKSCLSLRPSNLLTQSSWAIQLQTRSNYQLDSRGKYSLYVKMKDFLTYMIRFPVSFSKTWKNSQVSVHCPCVKKLSSLSARALPIPCFYGHQRRYDLGEGTIKATLLYLAIVNASSYQFLTNVRECLNKT